MKDFTFICRERGTKQNRNPQIMRRQPMTLRKSVGCSTAELLETRGEIDDIIQSVANVIRSLNEITVHDQVL